jgi:hypothetical protein
MLGKRLKMRTVSLKPSLWNISLLNRFEVLRVHKVARKKCVDCSAQRDAASKSLAEEEPMLLVRRRRPRSAGRRGRGS